MILMEIFSYVIDALLIYVFYDKYFSKERRREFASMAVIWGAFAMMEGINYVFNTVAPYIAVNMLVSVLGLFAMTLLYDAKVAKRIVAVVVFQVAAIVSEIFANVIFLVVPEKYFQDINVLGMFISKLFFASVSYDTYAFAEKTKKHSNTLSDHIFCNTDCLYICVMRIIS